MKIFTLLFSTKTFKVSEGQTEVGEVKATHIFGSFATKELAEEKVKNITELISEGRDQIRNLVGAEMELGHIEYQIHENEFFQKEQE